MRNRVHDLDPANQKEHLTVPVGFDYNQGTNVIWDEVKKVFVISDF